jgi:2-methylisocitrate lyase-like PEP mutase family enzyme
VCAASDLPVSAAHDGVLNQRPETWADTVRAAISAGVAGLSISDRQGSDLGSKGSLIERIRLARQVISDVGQDIVLQARCEGFLTETITQTALLSRVQAYAEAGADVLSIPGVEDQDLIKTVVSAVAPKAVSLVILDSSLDPRKICMLGVRRISLGFTFGADDWSGFESGYATLLSDTKWAVETAKGHPRLDSDRLGAGIYR